MQVLRVFKQLHRTRMDVFKDDDIALKGKLGYDTGCIMSVTICIMDCVDV